MGLLDKLRSLFVKKPLEEAIESTSIDQSAIESIASIDKLPSAEEPSTKSAEIERDSFQLGLAAGYTGKSIKEIEYSLSRVESQMITKDWFLSQSKDASTELIELLKKQEENNQKRFEILQTMLNSLHRTAELTPEPVRAELISQIKAIESHIPLTPKMQGLLLAVKEFKEISYDDLASKLGITVSALRGLLSNMTRRTDKIQRFSKNNKGWVRYLGD